MGKKVDWPIERFRDFGAAVHSARVALRRSRLDLDSIRGVRARIIDAGTAVETALHLSLVYGEDLLAVHHPSAAGRCVISEFLRWWPPDRNAPPRPRGSVLTREQWLTLGADVKLVTSVLSRLLVAVFPVSGAKPILRQLEAAERANERFRCGLDSVCVGQHPDWDDFTHVFYGERLHVAGVS